jgi:ribonuclease BN (tRNA processing enzyme)
MTDKFAFHTWEANSPARIGPFTVEPFVARHPVPAFSVRVEAAGKVVAYSGDTGPHDAIVDLARHADVFLSEASFVESQAATNPPDLHLTGRQAASYAREAGARRLLITHIPAWTDRDEVAADVEAGNFGGPTEFVRPGMSYEL